MLPWDMAYNRSDLICCLESCIFFFPLLLILAEFPLGNTFYYIKSFHKNATQEKQVVFARGL